MYNTYLMYLMYVQAWAQELGHIKWTFFVLMRCDCVSWLYSKSRALFSRKTSGKRKEMRCHSRNGNRTNREIHRNHDKHRGQRPPILCTHAPKQWSLRADLSPRPPLYCFSIFISFLGIFLKLYVKLKQMTMPSGKLVDVSSRVQGT